MGIYWNAGDILGLRILTSKRGDIDSYFVEHEFTGHNWKHRARKIVPFYLEQPNIIFQTLHPFSTSHNITTGHLTGPSEIWLNNIHFKIQDLF